MKRERIICGGSWLWLTELTEEIQIKIQITTDGAQAQTTGSSTSTERKCLAEESKGAALNRSQGTPHGEIPLQGEEVPSRYVCIGRAQTGKDRYKGAGMRFVQTIDPTECLRSLCADPAPSPIICRKNVSVNAEAVSYTHLDVYKRQV